MLCSFQIVINDTLRAIVAEYVEPAVLSDLSRRMRISQNRLRDIENVRETIYEKTYDLLGIWSKSFGCRAKVGVSKALF